MIRPVETRLTSEVLLGCLKEHRKELPRLQKLKRYYIDGQNGKPKPKDNPLAPNNNVVAPNPYYITTVANGFTFANPITYTGKNIDNLLDEFKRAKIAAHDAELGEDLSIYGRAYELIYMAKEPARHVKLNNLCPENSFVVWSNEIDPEPMFSAYYFPSMDQNGKETGYEINVYDSLKKYLYVQDSLDAMPVLIAEELHYAGGVPIVEYKNNDEGIGDYERVLSLIDAYNRLQSDRIDDKDQFVDAILTVYGATLTDGGSELMQEAIGNLRIYKILDGLPQDARAEYLKKALDEGGVEVLRTALKQDIAKYSMVPELTDESFAGVSSGVAMEYKTLGLKWLGNMKCRMFKKSLDRRFQIMNGYMKKLGKSFDWTDIDVIFDNALPVNKEALMPYAQTSLSQKTMITNLSSAFNVTDVDGEMEEIAKEKTEAVKLNQLAFDGGQPFGTGEEA